MKAISLDSKKVVQANGNRSASQKCCRGEEKIKRDNKRIHLEICYCSERVGGTDGTTDEWLIETERLTEGRQTDIPANKLISYFPGRPTTFARIPV